VRRLPGRTPGHRPERRVRSPSRVPWFRTRGARARGARSYSVEACWPANARPFAAVSHQELKPIVWPDVALDSNEVTLQLTNQPFNSKATRAGVGEDWVGFDCRLLEGRGGLRAVLEEQPGRVSVLVEDLGSAIAGSVPLATRAHWRARRAPWPAQLRRSKATCVIRRELHDCSTRRRCGLRVLPPSCRFVQGAHRRRSGS
jgi:hypothetical protein